MDVRQAPMMRGYMAYDEANGRWLLMLLLHPSGWITSRWRF